VGLRLADVTILGGGPAGSATALSLLSHAPRLSAVLIEASSYEGPRIGEVLPAPARTLLDHLDIWEAFQSERFRPVHSISSIWGHRLRRESHFIYSTHGAGWHLDRARFDAFLAEQATRRGVEVLSRTRLIGVERSKAGWDLRLSDGTDLRSRFVVEATGRRAAFARKMGARSRALDRLAGFARFFTLDDEPEPGTLIEAFAEGWWYTAIAGTRRVVACMTDTDVARRLGLSDQRRWLGLLSETDYVARSIGGGALDGPAITCAANSVSLEPVCAEDWIAVGDAASAFDPLSSQGIVKALRAGVYASYAIADRLDKDDSTGLARYESFVRREFNSYRRAHAEHCGQERRWPESRFWRRRQRKG
jgi:flavin-dependent dehydrogenase